MLQSQGAGRTAEETVRAQASIWHGRAFAEFSQVALHVPRNSRASRWALEPIGDEDF